MCGEQRNLPHLNASFPGCRWGRNYGELCPLCRKTKLSRDVLVFFSVDRTKKKTLQWQFLLQFYKEVTDTLSHRHVELLPCCCHWRKPEGEDCLINQRAAGITETGILKKGKDFWSVHSFLAFIWSKKGENCQLLFLFFFANYLQRRKTMIKLVWELNVQNDLFSRVMWLQRAWKKPKINVLTNTSVFFQIRGGKMFWLVGHNSL